MKQRNGEWVRGGNLSVSGAGIRLGDLIVLVVEKMNILNDNAI